MSLPPGRAAALLVGAGGAGAATMLALLVGDLTGGLEPGVRLGALGFALMVSLPLAFGLQAVMRPAAGTPGQVKGFATLGTMLWLAGVGLDLFRPEAPPSQLVAAHAAALLGALALVAAGLRLGPLSRLPTRAERRRRARGAP